MPEPYLYLFEGSRCLIDFDGEPDYLATGTDVKFLNCITDEVAETLMLAARHCWKDLPTMPMVKLQERSDRWQVRLRKIVGIDHV